MILPSKYVSMETSLLGQASTLLQCRRDEQTVSDLWTQVRALQPNLTFARFTAALTMLYALGSVDWSDGLLRWERA